MKGLTGKVETAANIAVIAVALFLAWSVCRYYFGVGPKASVDTKLASGQKIHLNGIDWEGNHKTFLVAVAPGCGFCEQSASFFRLLAKEIDSDRHCRLVFLLPQSADDAAGYLDTLGVGGRTFIKASFKSLGIAGTPTIVLANSGGNVLKVRTGKVRDDQMPEVLNSIPDAPNIGRITPGELKSALDRGGHIVVVDVSDRQGYATMHIPGAKNIPVDELHARALQELPDQGKVVLYCGCSEDQLSIFGVTILKTAFSGSYEGVVILAGGLNAWQAAGFPTESKALTLYNQ